MSATTSQTGENDQKVKRFLEVFNAKIISKEINMNIEGKIIGVSKKDTQKGPRYSYKIGDSWFSLLAHDGVKTEIKEMAQGLKAGDRLNVDYVISDPGGFKNITGMLKVVDIKDDMPPEHEEDNPVQQKSSSRMDFDSFKVRSMAMSYAKDVLVARISKGEPDLTAEEAVVVAKVFEKYMAGE